MGKSYDISKKSDVDQLGKDLEKMILDGTKEIVGSKKYEINCPNCKNKVSVPVGKSLCPSCGRQINLELDFDF